MSSFYYRLVKSIDGESHCLRNLAKENFHSNNYLLAELIKSFENILL